MRQYFRKLAGLLYGVWSECRTYSWGKATHLITCTPVIATLPEHINVRIMKHGIHYYCKLLGSIGLGGWGRRACFRVTLDVRITFSLFNCGTAPLEEWLFHLKYLHAMLVGVCGLVPE